MSKQVYDPLDEIVKRIIDSIHPEKIILFGSRSIGTTETERDYDICILKSGIKSRRKLAQKIYLLLLGVMASVDVIVETPEKFEKMKNNHFLIYNQIFKQGKIIYEK